MILLSVFYQLRSALSANTDLNIMFEFLSLLHLILTEQGKEVGHILFLAVVADSQVQAKRRLICQEKCIKFLLYLITAYVSILRLMGLLIEF
jgi:hypothetical protein